MSIKVETHGGVWIAIIDRPQVHNCIDRSTASSLAGAIGDFAADASARVLIVTGTGAEAFCTGADLKNPGGLVDHERFEDAGPLGFARLDPGKPTIAAIEGHCYAGGFELALWCDFRIAGDSAWFGFLNRRFGVPLIDGGTQRMARIAGMGTALYMIETGVRIDARKASELGIVQEVVPSGDALTRALEVAQDMAAFPQNSLLADRSSALGGIGLSVDDGLLQERTHGMATLADPQMAEGMARFASGERPEPMSHKSARP